MQRLIMGKITIEGGTNVATMALFDTSRLPAQLDKNQTRQMESEQTLIAMNMHADGGYAIHLFIDEDIPADVLEYCNFTNKNADFQPIQTEFNTTSGHIAFGGIESAVQGFHNPRIRNDIQIPPGRYQVNIYEAIAVDEAEKKEKEARESIGEKNLKRIETLSRLRWGTALFVLLGLLVTFAGNFTHAQSTGTLGHALPFIFILLAVATFCTSLWYNKHYQIKQLHQQIQAYYDNWESQQAFGLVAKLKRITP